MAKIGARSVAGFEALPGASASGRPKHGHWRCGRRLRASMAVVGSVVVALGVLPRVVVPVPTAGAQTVGSVWGWGGTSQGGPLLGTGGYLVSGFAAGALVPVSTGITGATRLAAGGAHILALRSDGSVIAWGDNQNGQLGISPSVYSSVPVSAGNAGGVGYKAIAGADWTSAGLANDNSVWTWGDGRYGELGNGVATATSLPQQVAGLSNVTQIAAGSNFFVALTASGEVWTWGKNDYGQVGNGTRWGAGVPSQTVPYRAVASGVVAIGAGTYAAYAVRADGTVLGWGTNAGGELLTLATVGLSTAAGVYTPTQLPGLANVQRLAGGYGFAVALRSDGSVVTFGQNGSGQLGNGTVLSSTSPVAVPGFIATAVFAQAGGNHVLATTPDGQLWGWGSGGAGQLGRGDTANQLSPALAGLGKTNWSSVVAGRNHSLAIDGVDRAAGTIWTVAGTTTTGFSGDGGRAEQAQLSFAKQFAALPDGTVYVSDRSNSRIRRVSPGGVILTYAGTGTPGFSGDGGDALFAQLSEPTAIDVGPDGSLYFSDGYFRLRRISPSRVISTIAGDGTPGSSGDGGPAMSARLHVVDALDVAPDGTVYLFDQSSSTIRRIDQSGNIARVAGNGVQGVSPDGTAALSASLHSIVDLEVASDGTIYFAEDGSNRIRRIAGGVISTVAGNGAVGFGGDGGPAAAAALNRANGGIALDVDGTLYIADRGNLRIRRVTLDGRIATISGGSGTYGGQDPEGRPALGFTVTSDMLQVVGSNLLFSDNARVRLIEGPVATLPAETPPTTSTTTSSTTTTTPVPPTGGRQLAEVRGLTSSRDLNFNMVLAADPVNTATGSFVHSVEDIATPGRGEPFVLQRSYDSQVASSPAVFGPGWGWNFGDRLTVNPTSSDVTWFNGSGSELVFKSSGGGSYQPPAGVFASLEASQPPGSGWVLRHRDQAVSTFNASGQLVGRVDRSGQGLAFAYDPTGRLVKITDAAGRPATLTYGTAGASNGRLTALTTSDGRDVRFRYTNVAGASRLTSFVDERNRIWTYSYSSAGRLVSEADPNGNTQFTNTYDGQGRVISQADQLGNVSTFAWNDAAQTATFTDAAGAVRTYGYSSYAITGQTGPEGSTSTSYDPSLSPSSFTDQTGSQWQATYDARGNMLTRAAPPPLSYVESWTYDQRNNPLTFTDGRGNTTVWAYDGSGRMLSETKPGGVTTSYVWNTDGTMASSTDPRGATTSYTYDTNGNPLTITSPMGNITSYTYDGAGRVLTITEPRGNVAGATAAQFQQKFTYDPDGNVVTERDALNRLTRHEYDAGGRRIKTTAPDSGVTSYGYNAANELVSMTSPDGGITTYEYDSRGQRTRETSPVGGVTTFGYDAAGRMVRRVEPRGNVAGANPDDFAWTFTYDGVGRTLTETDPTGRVTSFVYDPLGRLVTTTRPNGTTTTAYDPNGNTTSVTISGIGATTTVYDPLNRPVSVTDPRGKTSTAIYDPAGNLISATDPLGRTTTYSYDPDGRRASMVDARGNAAGANPVDYTTAYGYDAAGNQTSMTDPLGNQTLTTFNRVGQPQQIRNPRGFNTNYAYDDMDRVTRVTKPVVGATVYGYSLVGMMTSRTDPLGRVSTWSYDVGRRLTAKTDPLGRTFTYGYDVAGNNTQIVDANANAAANPALGTTSFTYDVLNRPTSKAFSDATSPIIWTYDSAGRRATMTDGVGITGYTYDDANRPTQITRGSDIWTYTYDANGNVLTRQLPGGANSSATYDDAGQLAAVTDHSGETTTYSYDPVGNPLGISLPNGVNQTRLWDRASRLVQITNNGPSGPIGSFLYTRDANGNPIATDVAGPAGVIVAESSRNTYDAVDRLTRSCATTTTCNANNRTLWTYDDVGNRLTETIGTTPASTYAYDNADQLTSITGPNPVGFNYNANGDMTTANDSTYVYNTNRQIVADTTNGTTRVYSYDGDGNRATVNTQGSIIRELWDTTTALPTLVAERDTTGTALRRYTYGQGIDPLRYDDLVTSGAGRYLTDTIGSVTNITDPAGNIAATYRYNAHGTARATTSVAAPFANNPMRYTGQQQQPNGTYNLRARHYNPFWGRFTQVDPLPYGPGSPFESAYVYAMSRPTVLIDPSGRRGTFPQTGMKCGMNEAGLPDCSPLPLRAPEPPVPDVELKAKWTTISKVTANAGIVIRMPFSNWDRVRGDQYEFRVRGLPSVAATVANLSLDVIVLYMTSTGDPAGGASIHPPYRGQQTVDLSGKSRWFTGLRPGLFYAVVGSREALSSGDVADAFSSLASVSPSGWGGLASPNDGRPGIPWAQFVLETQSRKRW
jgi:RHS repeat-associated protein